MYGFAFNEKGEAVNMEEAVFTVGFVDGVIRSWVVDDANVNNVYTTVLYVKYNNKYYAFNITVGNSDSAVKGLDADAKKEGRIYDLAGRVVKQPTKGLYIKDGKKILIK